MKPYLKEKENRIYPNNRIKTTKYTLINFLPKSLLLQFNKVANIYFLIVTILTFGSFSPINPASMIGTFIFVLICTMIKEAYEDFNSEKLDCLEELGEMNGHIPADCPEKIKKYFKWLDSEEK